MISGKKKIMYVADDGWTTEKLPWTGREINIQGNVKILLNIILERL